MQTLRTIGRYQVKRWLASGAMGEVYEAKDPLIGRLVAIKLLRSDLAERGDTVGWLNRFQREAHTAGQHQHPNIVTIYDFGEEGGNPFFVMEYVDGETLADRLKRSAPLAEDEAITIMSQVLGALGFAHANGIIHRDIKPSNILVTQAGLVKVTDFGIARTADSDLTIAGDILGTPSYMAPEQLSGGTIDHRVDLFAAGAVLFELLTGTKPFQGKGVFETLVMMERTGPEDVRVLNPSVTPALKTVIDKAMAFDPARRYASAEQFSDAIAIVSGRPLRAVTEAEPNDKTKLIPQVSTSPPPSPSNHSVPPYTRGAGSLVNATSSDPNSLGSQSIAVLPFQAPGGNAEQDYFADSITQEITTALSRITWLTVVSRNSSFSSKDRDIDQRSVGRERDVRYVLEGSVRRAGQRVRIVGRLIETSSGIQLWADRFDGPVDDSFDFQDQVAQGVVAAIERRLGGLPVDERSPSADDNAAPFRLPTAPVVSAATVQSIAGSDTLLPGPKLRRVRWVISAGAGALALATGLAIFAFPGVFNFASSPKAPGTPTTAMAPPASPMRPLQAIGVAEKPTAEPTVTSAPTPAPSSSASAPGALITLPTPLPREAFDPEKVPFVKSREDVRRYQAGGRPKALALSRSGGTWWKSTPRQALEACEFWHREPCILYAVDDLVEPAPGGAWTPRPTLGSGEGRFIPAEVPFISNNARQSISTYVTGKSPKAFAVSPHGNYGLAAGDVVSIEEAQRVALSRCQEGENRVRVEYRRPCYVYAIDDTVVLAKRATAPMDANTDQLRDLLAANLASALPKLSAETREARARSYEAYNAHKAQAASVERQGTWASASRPNVEDAEISALEQCQVFYGFPCILLATNERVQPAPADGNWSRREMPRARYAGTFDPAQIPGAGPGVRADAKVMHYLSAPAPKAAAYHPSGGVLFIVTNGVSQRATEEETLKLCNADPNRNKGLGPCFLYAVADSVVLSQRITQPLTAR